jgi:predicted transcriptional regulator
MNAPTNTAQVLTLHTPKETQHQSEKKWGKAVIGYGFSILPVLLFRAQARLGLDSNQMLVLLHLADHWWYQDNLPYPSKATLAGRMGLSERTVQRCITQLQKGGFLARRERFATHKGQLSNEYDLSGLVEKIQKLEPEFRAAREQNKRVGKRGDLSVAAQVFGKKNLDDAGKA